jgi:hypothetical protein
MAIPAILSEKTSLTELSRKTKPPSSPPTIPKKLAIVPTSPLFYYHAANFLPSAPIEAAQISPLLTAAVCIET